MGDGLFVVGACRRAAAASRSAPGGRRPAGEAGSVPGGGADRTGSSVVTAPTVTPSGRQNPARARTGCDCSLTERRGTPAPRVTLPYNRATSRRRGSAATPARAPPPTGDDGVLRRQPTLGGTHARQRTVRRGHRPRGDRPRRRPGGLGLRLRTWSAPCWPPTRGRRSMREIAQAVQEGAGAYLRRQFRTLAVFAVIVFLAAPRPARDRRRLGHAHRARAVLPARCRVLRAGRLHRHDAGHPRQRPGRRGGADRRLPAGLPDRLPHRRRLRDDHRRPRACSVRRWRC